MAHILPVFPVESATERLRRLYPYTSDTDALRSDWERIGQDLRVALNKVEKDIHGQVAQTKIWPSAKVTPRAKYPIR